MVPRSSCSPARATMRGPLPLWARTSRAPPACAPQRSLCGRGGPVLICGLPRRRCSSPQESKRTEPRRCCCVEAHAAGAAAAPWSAGRAGALGHRARPHRRVGRRLGKKKAEGCAGLGCESTESCCCWDILTHDAEEGVGLRHHDGVLTAELEQRYQQQQQRQEEQLTQFSLIPSPPALQRRHTQGRTSPQRPRSHVMTPWHPCSVRMRHWAMSEAATC